MIAQDLLSKVIPPLRLTDTGRKALDWMEIFRISHLPVVDDKTLVGLISEEIIYDLNIIDKPVNVYADHLLSPHIYANQHIYEVISVFSASQLSAIPVLNANQDYLGIITILDLSLKIIDLIAVHETGGVLVLELNAIDYSLSQIAQIVESNDARILSFYVSQHVDSSRMTITIKLNVIDLSAIIQTFVRYDYDIVTVYMDDSVIRNFYDDRYDLLMKYINV